MKRDREKVERFRVAHLTWKATAAVFLRGYAQSQ